MQKLISNTSASWKTTLAGVVQWAIVVLQQAQLMLDGVAETAPDWNIVVVSTTVMLGLLVARDGDKTSEDAGAK